MMLLPVIERFAELGWRAFVEPGETYELFSVSGIFKRVHVNTTACDSSASPSSSADAAQQQLAQRHALFDVCLSSGLAHLVVAYICASESNDASMASTAHDGKRYVLNEPVAVQQWLRHRVDSMEKSVHADVSALVHARDHIANNDHSAASTPTDHHHHNRMHRKGGHKPGDLETHMRELSGLRAVAMALVERLKESAAQLEANALALRSLPPSMANQRREDLLKQTELARLTHEGIQLLLELLFRAQSATLTCQCLQWFKEHHVVFDADQYHEFYYQARSARASLRQSFEGSYEVVLSSVSNSDIAFPSLLIELVLQNAGVGENLSLPPDGIANLFQLLEAPTVHAETVQLYAEEIRHAPVESFFRVQSAMLLYFALDLAYVSLMQTPSHNHHAWLGMELVDHFVDIADSFAAQMGVPNDMKATLLAIWLIENAVNVRLASNEEVGPIYQGAVTRLLESSAIHLQRKAGLEAELILYMVETLVHRGESSIAWKIWTAFDMELGALPPVATEYAVMVNLELTAWERALSLLRIQRRLDLLPLVFKWLVKNNRIKELIHYTTLTRDEEIVLDEFMMNGRVLGDEVSHDVSIRKADLLVMYYVLRNQFDKAWAVHHEHLALIRESTSGNTNVAQAVIHQQSFRIRAALLQNMKPEPTTSASPDYNFKRAVRVTRPVDTDVMMIGSGGVPLLQLPETSASEDERMSDEFVLAPAMPDAAMPPSTGAGATPQRRRETPGADGVEASTATPSHAPTPFAYSPGIFSSRSSQPRSVSSAKSTGPSMSSFLSDATPAASTRPNVPIGSIDSSPATSSTGPFRGHVDDASAKRVVQTLNFGLSPVVPHGGTSGNPTPSSDYGKSTSDRPRAFVLQPVRSAFNSAYSSLPPKPASSPSVSEDLSLRPRSASAGDTKPVDVQVGSTTGLSPATTVNGTPPSTIAAAASTAAQDLTLFATPKRFQFVREPPKTDSRVVARSHDAAAVRSPASQELEAMELEPIDEEFSTPAARAGRAPARKEPQSVPTRRNPRRNTRSLY